eukprot:7368738-Pyramimonas_sp.AAC.2
MPSETMQSGPIRVGFHICGLFLFLPLILILLLSLLFLVILPRSPRLSSCIILFLLLALLRASSLELDRQFWKKGPNRLPWHSHESEGAPQLRDWKESWALPAWAVQGITALLKYICQRCEC